MHNLNTVGNTPSRKIKLGRIPVTGFSIRIHLCGAPLNDGPHHLSGSLEDSRFEGSWAVDNTVVSRAFKENICNFGCIYVRNP